jgi:hypothetical protein
MNSRVGAGSVRGERWRWLLYVAMAFAGALLTFVGARAQQKATDQATFRSLIDAYCTAWSTADAKRPGKVLRQGGRSDFLRHCSLLVSWMEGIP